MNVLSMALGLPCIRLLKDDYCITFLNTKDSGLDKMFYLLITKQWPSRKGKKKKMKKPIFSDLLISLPYYSLFYCLHLR